MAHWTSASLADTAYTSPPQARPNLKKCHTSPRLPRNHSSRKHQSSKRSRDLKHKELSPEASDDEGDTMSSFPSFCTTCEQQLSHSTGLYCSEKCRKQDLHASPTHISQDSQWQPSASHNRLNASIDSIRNIVPQMIPSPPPAIMPGMQAHAARSSEEPGSAGGRRRATRPPVDRSESEAARYLAQFHSRDRPQSRPRGVRPASSTEDVLPGLSSAASSLTSTSTPPTPSTSLHQAPSRKNRWSSAFATQTLELVTPTSGQPSAIISPAVTVTAAMAHESCMPCSPVSPSRHQMPFEKRKPIASSEVSSGRGSLKQLFTSGESGPQVAEEA